MAELHRVAASFGRGRSTRACVLVRMLVLVLMCGGRLWWKVIYCSTRQSCATIAVFAMRRVQHPPFSDSVFRYCRMDIAVWMGFYCRGACKNHQLL